MCLGQLASKHSAALAPKEGRSFDHAAALGSGEGTSFDHAATLAAGEGESFNRAAALTSEEGERNLTSEFSIQEIEYQLDASSRNEGVLGMALDTENRTYDTHCHELAGSWGATARGERGSASRRFSKRLWV